MECRYNYKKTTAPRRGRLDQPALRDAAFGVGVTGNELPAYFQFAPPGRSSPAPEIFAGKQDFHG